MINGFDDIDYLQNIKEELWALQTNCLTKNKQLLITPYIFKNLGV